MEWDDVRMLCARYLVASEQMERSGPVHAAVRSAGYVSEEEEDEEGLYQDEVVEEGEGPPGYSHPIKANGIEMGPNGYIVSGVRLHVRFCVILTSYIWQLDKKDAIGDGVGANVSRRPSKRQQDKVPEGHAPHAQGRSRRQCPCFHERPPCEQGGGRRWARSC